MTPEEQAIIKDKLIVEQIGSTEQRREILDWYHLMENRPEVGGSNPRLRQARNYLWQGFLQDAIAEFNDFNNTSWT